MTAGGTQNNVRSNLDGLVVAPLTDESRFGEVLELVHVAFGALTPRSGALDETVADVAARFRAGPILLAEDRGELVGSVFCATKNGSLYLTRMAVKPNRQKQGIGRALMAAAEAQARALGLTRLSLRVRVNLPGNRRYFERFGFRVTGQGQDPGRPPYDAMARQI
jgi:predicted N-acetyltransferase YhbS